MNDQHNKAGVKGGPSEAGSDRVQSQQDVAGRVDDLHKQDKQDLAGRMDDLRKQAQEKWVAGGAADQQQKVQEQVAASLAPPPVVTKPGFMSKLSAFLKKDTSQGKK